MITMNDVRKNLSIIGDNDKRIQNNRSAFLGLDTPIDIDYSKMVNMLIELGDVLIKLKNNPESGESEHDAQINTITGTEITKIIERYTT